MFELLEGDGRHALVGGQELAAPLPQADGVRAEEGGEGGDEDDLATALIPFLVQAFHAPLEAPLRLFLLLLAQ